MATLTVRRRNTSTPPAEAKSKAKAAKASSDAPKNKGKTLGLNVRQTWCHMFVQNEKAAKKDRLTDEQILAFMQKEFPGRDSFEFTDPKGVRSTRRAYNSGLFLDGKKPSLQSSRYDSEGNEIPAFSRSEDAPAKGKSKSGSKSGGKGK